MIKRRKIDPAVMKLLTEYHTYHGDRNIRYAGEMHRPQGSVLYLVRLENAQGKEFSCIDMICHGADGEYVTELYSAKRADEQKIIMWAAEVEEDAAD